MPDSNHCLIYSTHPSLEQARQTAHALVAESLAACCNILPAMESHYLWEGKPMHSNEYAMITKTTRATAPAVMDAIAQQHPYDCPAVLQLPVDAGNPDFLRWIEERVQSSR